MSESQRGNGVQCKKEVFEEIMGKNFSDLVKDINLQIQTAQGMSNKINPKESMHRSSIIKLPKYKTKKTLKAARDKWHFVQRETLICIIVDFTYKTMEARRKWNNSFKLLKEKNCPPRILYLEKTPFRNKGEIKTLNEGQQNVAPTDLKNKY